MHVLVLFGMLFRIFCDDIANIAPRTRHADFRSNKSLISYQGLNCKLNVHLHNCLKVGVTNIDDQLSRRDRSRC